MEVICASYLDETGVVVAAIVMAEEKMTLFGDLRYLPLPLGEGRGTLDHLPTSRPKD